MRFTRVALVLSLSAIGLLTAAGYAAGAPYRIPDGSLYDLVAAAVFTANFIPGLVSAALVRMLNASALTEFLLVGVSWACLSAAQWLLLGHWISRRTRAR